MTIGQPTLEPGIVMTHAVSVRVPLSPDRVDHASLHVTCSLRPRWMSDAQRPPDIGGKTSNRSLSCRRVPGRTAVPFTTYVCRPSGRASSTATSSTVDRSLSSMSSCPPGRRSARIPFSVTWTCTRVLLTLSYPVLGFHQLKDPEPFNRRLRDEKTDLNEARETADLDGA